MGSETRADRIRAGEAVTPDHLPTCPRCAELLEAWRLYCPYCDSPLYLEQGPAPSAAGHEVRRGA